MIRTFGTDPHRQLWDAPDIGRYHGSVFLAPIARGNLQIHWPEGNVILRRGVVDVMGGVPDYNAEVTLDKELGEPFDPT